MYQTLNPSSPSSWVSTSPQPIKEHAKPLNYSLKLGPQHLQPRIIILERHPTDDIPHKLHGLEVISPVDHNDKQTQNKVVNQEQIQQEKLGGSLEDDLVLFDLELAEIR